MKSVGRLAIAFLVVHALGCGTQSGSGGGEVSGKLLSSYASDPGHNLRISLTDAPAKDLKSVFVNIKYIELFLQTKLSEGRVRVGQGLGLVDLLTLRNGVLLPVEDAALPPGITITKIRLVLESNDNYSVRSDDSRCDMQTPSAQKSGVKIHLSNPVTLEPNRQYSMVLDFDAGKSVVVKGNGGCLLKPVLKLLSVTSVVQNPDDEVLGGGGNEQPVTDGTDDNSGVESGGGDDDGFSDVEDPDDPPFMSIEDSFNMP